MAEPGTDTARPTAWGPKVTTDWWSKASDALLRRLVGFGQGEGPPQEQNERLAKGLQILFHADRSDDLGERSVRTFLKGNEEPTDVLYVRLGDALVERCAPVLRRELAELEPQGDSQGTPSAAVDTSRPRPAPKPQGTTVVRPKPPGSPPYWWQRWIEQQNARYDTERDKRLIVYQSFLTGLSRKNVDTFAKIPAVLPNIDYWKTLFDRAVAIAQLGIGIPSGDLDDAYHVPSLPVVPENLQSYWLLGELVHAQWQFEYMDARPTSDVLAEYLLSKGASPRNPKGYRRPFVDWRRMHTDPESPDEVGAMQWAIGNGRPDIVDFTKTSIFEIKPVRTAHYGVLQLWRYTHNYNCARYFDWLEKPGGIGKSMPLPLVPGRLEDTFFKHVDPSTFLEEYFAARDEKRGAGKIPKSRQRARRSEIEGVLERGGKIKALPLPAAGIPGLVLYYVHQEKNRSDKPKKPIDTSRVVQVVTGILVITAVLVAIFLTGPAGGVGTAAALTEGTAASTAVAEGGAVASAALAGSGAVAGEAAAATMEPVVETFAGALTAKEFEAAAGQMSSQLDALNAAGVL